jgi:PAS domain S-box-containing protein
MRTEEPRGGIERKILTVVVWIGLLPMILALIIGYANAREGQRKAVQQTLASTTKDRAEGFEHATHAIISRVDALSHSPDVIAWLTGPQPTLTAFSAWLNLVVQQTAQGGDVPSDFTLYRASGEVIVSTVAEGELPFNMEAWVGKIGEPGMVHLEYDYVNSRYVGIFLAPIHGPDGEELGYIAERADLERLLTYALSPGAQSGTQRTSADIYRFVFEGPQDVLLSAKLKETRPDRPEACEENIANVLRQAAAPRADAQFLSIYMSRNISINVLFAYYRLESSRPMYMVAFRPTAVAYSNINLGALLSAVASVIVIAVLCLVAYRNIHKNIVLPLSLLNEGAQIIRQGDLDLKLKIDTGDEIEELAVSFNKMAAALRDNIHQLEESEEKYRGLVTSMRDGIYQADLDGVISFLNPAGLDIFGFGHVDEALGLQLSTLFHDERDFLRIRDELREHGFVERSRVWMRRRDAKVICIEISSNRVYDENARVLGMEGIFRDVTKSVRLEQDVRERAERISAINQIANVINSNLEVDSLFDSLVIEVKKLVDFDYSAVALLTERGDVFNVRQLWPEQELPPGRSFQLDRERSCSGWVTEQRGSLIVDDLSADGAAYLQEFPAEMQSFIAVPLYAQESIIGTLNLASRQKAAFSKHDIEVLEQVAPHVAVAIHNAQLLESLQQSLEEVTQAREKLHEANEELKTLDEMKTNLLSNVSHELRTPLVAVMGYTDMIINEKVGPVNNVQREYLGISLRNIEKLVTLIENLLDFSRLHRGAEKLVFSAFDLVEAAETSLQIVRPVADGRDIKLILNTPEDKIMVEGDKGKIGQVFNNLLSNAVKFNHSGGSVTIDIRPGDEGVEVLVSDTGIGIPPEALDKVFTRFYQYDSSSTRKYGGTGIGLAIAQDIARLHGTRITVSSEVGKGTTFRFVMPLRGGKPRREREPEGGEELSSQTHLLIELVTQDRALSTQVRNLLVAEGMDVIHASNPEYALSLASKHRPDCLLVDVENNGSGGILMDSLLKDSTTKAIPIALLTNDDTIYSKYREVVACRIKRSFRKSTLMSGIRSALSSDSATHTPGGGKILCVDDDNEILMFMQRCLENEGYLTEGCGSGEEAVKKAASGEFSLVLLDIAMPGIDGWEACEQMRADSALAGMKIFIVTAKPVDLAPQRLREVGADGYLMKPFRPEDLVSLVQSLGIFQPTTE